MLSTFQIWLQVASFAIAVGGLVVFFIDEKHRKKLAIVIISSLITLTFVILILSYLHYVEISDVAQDILILLGNQSMTFDQIYLNLVFIDIPTVNKALEQLVKSGKIGHSLVQVRDQYGIVYSVLVYYVQNQ